MALATRNLYLVLKARDEASRVVRGFGRELTRAGAAAQAEALRQRAYNMMVAAQEQALANQRTVNALRNKAAMAAEAAALLQSRGARERDIELKRQLARRLRAEASDLARTAAVNLQATQLEASQLRQRAMNLEQTRRSAIRLSNALHTVSATWITVGSGIAFAGAGGIFALTQMVKVAAEYERQVRLTKTQVDNFNASLEEIADVGRRVARDIAIPFEQIQPALYNILSSTNANLKQAEILLRGFSKTAVAGQVSIEDAARGTIPILNAFNVPLEKVNDILDIQFQLVRKGVGTYGEFSKVFGRVVSAATRSGQSFQTVAAMLAFMTRNGLSAAMAATSAARALEAMSHPKSVANMEKLGIKIRDAKGNFLPLEQMLTGLRDKLLKMPKADRVEALVDIFRGAGGTIQARRFLEQVLLRPGELEEYIAFLGDMKNANGAFGQAYGEMAGSVAAQTEIMRNRWKLLQESLGKAITPAFIVIIGFISQLLDKFNQLPQSTKKVIAIGILLTSMFALLGGVAVIVLGALAGIFAAVTAAGAGFFILIGVVAATVAGIAAFGAAAYLAWQRSAGLRDLLIQIKDAAVRFYQEGLLPAAKGIREAWETHIAPVLGQIAEKLEAHVFPVLSSLVYAFTQKIIPAVAEVSNFLRVVFTRAVEFVASVIKTYLLPMFEILHRYYLEHKNAIDKVIAVLIFLGKWFLKIAAVIGVILVAVLVGPIVGALVGFAALIMTAIHVVIKLIEWVTSIINWFRRLGDNAKTSSATVKNAFGTVITFFQTMGARIAAAVGNLGSLLINAGRSLIEGLMRGIDAATGGLLGKISGLASKIRGAFPFSPAKWGPLAGRGDLLYAGRQMVERLGEGMRQAQGDLAYATGGLAGGARQTLVAAPTTGGRTINQTFNVTTQEISPRVHAAELGRELAGRM